MLDFFSNRASWETCNCVDDSNITTSFHESDGKWCCRYGKEDCFKERWGVRCSGKTLSLSQQCHDGDDTTPVCNYIHSNPDRNDIYIGERSYLDVCKDNM